MITAKPSAIRSTTLIFIAAVWLQISSNLSFYQQLLEVYPAELTNLPFLFSVSLFFTALGFIFLWSLCHGPLTKPLLILVLLLSSQTAYFMDSYHVVIDDSMVDNTLKTDLHETLDLLSLRQVLYFFVLGLMPAIWVWRTPILAMTLKRYILHRIISLAVAVALIVALVALQGGYYASFLREHKAVRMFSNPGYPLYSLAKFSLEQLNSGAAQLLAIARDARIVEPDEVGDRELVIFVVGETARADHFSLNGYGRDTNPLLAKQQIYSFDNAWSCGTSTAYSVPCMFSIYTEQNYSKTKAAQTENLLDILQRSGVKVLWLDNNSDSKGVADRVPYESYKTPDTNPVCDSECRDVGMLAHLQEYIDAQPTGDIFIVLHQMGNHGPAYYKRYPPEFEHFKPVCESNQLEQCSKEEIDNAYDNALRYTDYFLNQTIELLQRNNPEFETAMVYMSDHGESLGENNLYLHGMPKMLAPDTQVHVPMILWFGPVFGEELNSARLAGLVHEKLSHDNLFHTLLGLFEVETEVYQPGLDLLAPINQP